ncbi:TRAP transporter substrate-binding protein DctP [Metallumcola ferriviriculae]|uniref:TRAP transporter substrate-binding protein DctP n=1 Tax=Metallumcola ferriviriculae TaxID=3039180 RepID=A0AAU0UQ09_9FIRM|nr:TRAP transporter substrate-binding protein DctP [Desulfitibacteraceae bacterium MK1]
MKKKLSWGILILMFILALVAVSGCGGSSDKQVNTGKQETTGSTDEGQPAEVEPIELRLSSGLGQVHFWVGNYMDNFADEIEKETNIEFDRYYAGELVKVGRELDALKGGTIDVAAPFLAPYHEGLFPLSDVTQLPLLNSDSTMVTKAFQKLMDSDVDLKDGQSFYDYEFTSKGLVAWPLGATEKYALSTAGKEFNTINDFSGVPIRAGSTLAMMAVENLGLTPVYMPSADAYEAISKGTLDGLISSIGDWQSYGFQELVEYTIVGINMGHWESYLTLTKETWDALPADVQETWDRVAREQALKNAKYITSLDVAQIEESKAKGAVFEDISDLDPAVQGHFTQAATKTWERWIAAVEKEGHPAEAAAKLWAQLILEEGGTLPDGVSELLGL